MSDMARCEKCLHFEVCEALEQGNGLMRVHPIHCGYYKPTADVVPREAVEEFADRLIRYYDSLNGGTASGLVAYHVNKIRQEMLNKEENT